MPASLNPRDVLRIWDRYTSPNKPKRHICVSPDRQLFLRINSEALFQPAHLLLRKNNPTFLKFDSYVELQQPVFHYNDDIREAELLGRISKPEATTLNASAQSAETLTPEQKRIIEEGLLSS